MKAIIVWVLVLPGPNAYPPERFSTHAECVQAKRDYNRSSTSRTDGRSQKGMAYCRDRPRYVTE